MAILDNKKFMICCVNGVGSSLMMKGTLEKILKKYDVEPSIVRHCGVSEGKSTAADYNVILCSRNLEGMFADAKAKGVAIIGLNNVMSEEEMEAALMSAQLL